MKSGNLNLLETSGPQRAWYGTPLPLSLYILVKYIRRESPFLPHLTAFMTYAIMMQFEDILPVTTRYKKSLRVTFTQNSFSEHIVLIRIFYFVVERCAGNTNVKSHFHVLDIRRQKHEMLTVECIDEPTRCNNDLLIYKISSTCFGEYFAHHQEHETEIFTAYGILQRWI